MFSIFDLIKQYKERKRLKEERENLKHDARMQVKLEKELARVNNHREIMLNKSCPLNNGDNCFAKCVHFRNGYAKKAIFMNDEYITSDYSRCKLWYKN
jgi:hypothetical protein